MARFKVGIIRKDDAEEFFRIFRTHKAAFRGDVFHNFSASEPLFQRTECYPAGIEPLRQIRQFWSRSMVAIKACTSGREESPTSGGSEVCYCRRRFDVLSSVELGINRPSPGPDHRNGDPKGS